MDNRESMALFSSAPVSEAVFKNALPAMAAMLMVLVYNLADTFFIGQTGDDLQVAAVSLATPVFLIFMALGTIFGVGGTSVISRTLGQGIQPLLGYCAGARLWGRFRKILRFSTVFAFCLSAVLTGICILFTEQIVGAFLTDATAFAYAVKFSRILLSTGVVFGVFYVLTNALQAMGRRSPR